MEEHLPESTNTEKEDNREKITDPAEFVKLYSQSEDYKILYAEFRKNFLASRRSGHFEEKVIKTSFWASKDVEYGIVGFNISNPKYRFNYTTQSVEPKTAEAIDHYIQTINEHNKFDRRGDIGDNQDEIMRFDTLRTKYHNEGADLVSAELLKKRALGDVEDDFVPRRIGRGFLRLVAIQKLGVQGS